MNGIIASVKKGSLAFEAGIKKGDNLIAVNNKKVIDIISLSFLMLDTFVKVEIKTKDGETKFIDINKQLDEDIGLEFETAVFDGIHRCQNNCVFCFVDQMIPGMRNSLYIKDDDYRLSFLYGNFITLTNMSEDDYQYIINNHLSPLYISVHATDPNARVKIMKNKFAGQILKNIERLINAGIEIHTQVVLCPGYNDGEILEQTFQDLFKYFPMVKTLAVVPVGVTKNRGDLQDLELFTKETALKVIEKVNQWQKMARKKTGKSFIYVGDELYLLANKPIPKAEIYDGFPQLENGIGLARTFIDEWENTKLVTTNNSKQYTKAIIPIGESIYVVIKPLIDEFNKRNNTRHKLLPIKNNFFGDTVNITGLITAVDIKNTLKNDSYNYDVLILPQVILNSDNMFLDGISYEDFVASFDVPVKLAANAYELKNLLNK